MARESSVPPSAIQTGSARDASSAGIQLSHRHATIGERCRSASTQAKLSWNPAFVASDGVVVSITMAAIASTASPFHSRPSEAPQAPTIDMSADLIALAAGAIRQSASSAAMPTASACTRSSLLASRAAVAATHPSTARLKPEIARMCESPTARKESSIARYPTSTSPRTSATSIERTAQPPESSSAGTPARSPVRSADRTVSRSLIADQRSDPSSCEASITEIVPLDSTMIPPATPASARCSPIRSDPGSVGFGGPRSQPTIEIREPIAGSCGRSGAETVSRESGSSSLLRIPFSSTNTMSSTTAWNLGGRTRWRARMSVDPLRSTNGSTSVASMRASWRSSASASTGRVAAETVSMKRSPAPRSAAPTQRNTAAAVVRARDEGPVRMRSTTHGRHPPAQSAARSRHGFQSSSAQGARSIAANPVATLPALPAQSASAKRQVAGEASPRNGCGPSASA